MPGVYLVLMTPRRCSRMARTASSGDMPTISISASATMIGARPRPATQWMAMQSPFLRASTSRVSWTNWSEMGRDGGSPSGNSQSCAGQAREPAGKRGVAPIACSNGEGGCPYYAPQSLTYVRGDAGVGQTLHAVGRRADTHKVGDLVHLENLQQGGECT